MAVSEVKGLCGLGHRRMGCFERSWNQPQEGIMKRSSKRQARRWVIQELTRCLEQRGEPLPPIKSAPD
jgi:diphthamide synthase subunit DPH2